MRFLSLVTTVLLSLTLLASTAHAKISAKINLSTQTMTVRVDGRKRYVWRISSGKEGYLTPRGSFQPHSVEEMHFSKQYENAPMPYSVFFNSGIAVHGTYATRRLGRPASHGCVRVSVRNAKRFHDLVKAHGKKRTRIKVIGRTPLYAKLKPRRHKRRKHKRQRRSRRYYNQDVYADDYYYARRRRRHVMDYDYY